VRIITLVQQMYWNMAYLFLTDEWIRIPPPNRRNLRLKFPFQRSKKKKSADRVPVTFGARSYLCFNAFYFNAWSAVVAWKIFHLNWFMSSGANTSGFSILATSRQASYASEISTITHRSVYVRSTWIWTRYRSSTIL
jgi:hypothetical protein